MSRTAPALLLPALLVVALSACSAPTPTPTARPTVTVTGSSPASPIASSTTSTGSAPSASASTAVADPARPAGQCPDDSLQVTLGPGEGAAGTGYIPVVFTNTGSGSCVLRGAPGVSVVGLGDGTQLGAPAARDQSGARDVRLAGHGGRAHATLAAVDFAPGDGSPLQGCTPKKGDGYRVYPPHSTRAFFIRDAGVLACDPGPSFMRIGVVAGGASDGK